MNQQDLVEKYAYKGWCVMTTIVVNCLEKIQMNHSLYTTQLVEDNLSINKDIAITINASIAAKNKIVPYSSLLTNGQKVFFDLAAYPFFERIHAAISEQGNNCGVLRFRRSGPSNECIGDLFVLSQLFGDISQVYSVRRELESKMHCIILCKFGNEVVAHIEYTTDSIERIEFEFSSSHQIIEFDSAEMVPTNLYNNLQYNVDCILKFAVELNDTHLETLRHIEEQVGGNCI